MDNNPSEDSNSHDAYVGAALILLSIAGLDSKFDPETLAQLAELAVTVMSGFIGVFIVINRKKIGVKKDHVEVNDVNDVDTRTEQAATPLAGEQPASYKLPTPVRTDSERRE